MTRNPVGATLLGVALFGGLPATIYAFSQGQTGAAALAAAITVILFVLGTQAERHEDVRQGEEEAARVRKLNRQEEPRDETPEF